VHPDQGDVGRAEVLGRAVVDRPGGLGRHRVLRPEVGDPAVGEPLLREPVDPVVVLAGVGARHHAAARQHLERVLLVREEDRPAQPPGVGRRLGGEVIPVGRVVIGRHHEDLPGRERDLRDDRRRGEDVGADPRVPVAVGRHPQPRVPEAVPGLVDLDERARVVPPELHRHEARRVAGLVGPVVGNVVDRVELVQVGDVRGVQVAVHRLDPVAVDRLLVRPDQRRR
jgi:hypothetical protein